MSCRELHLKQVIDLTGQDKKSYETRSITDSALRNLRVKSLNLMNVAAIQPKLGKMLKAF